MRRKIYQLGFSVKSKSSFYLLLGSKIVDAYSCMLESAAFTGNVLIAFRMLYQTVYRSSVSIHSKCWSPTSCMNLNSVYSNRSSFICSGLCMPRRRMLLRTLMRGERYVVTVRVRFQLIRIYHHPRRE